MRHPQCMHVSKMDHRLIKRSTTSLLHFRKAGVIAIKARCVSISQLAENPQRLIGMPIWDNSGLTGEFNFTFRFKELNSGELDTDAPSLVTALEQNFGLKLTKRKGLIETLVIDHAEEPSAN